MKKEKLYINVKEVVKDFLCCGCGTCLGVCPKLSIAMQNDRYGNCVPVINTQTCNNCGICVKACPGVGFDYFYFNKKIHGKTPEHITMGAFIEGYAGYTKDEEILGKSQSGGFVSNLLIYCLEKRIIDGAIVSRWSDQDPLKPETYIAKTREDILACVGSIYNPVPASQIISQILKLKGKYAFVGTSCQIQGFRKAEEIYKNRISEKIAFYLGLHCYGVFTYHFNSHMLNKMKVRKIDLKKYIYRDKEWKGWPGDMRLLDKSGQILNIDAMESRIFPRPFFTNWRCRLCFDKGNEFSDISCGDCHNPAIHKKLINNGYNLKKGLSEFAVRTERGKAITDKFIEDNQMVLHQVTSDELASSIGIAGKKLGLNAFFKVARLFKKATPSYGVRFFMPGKKNDLSQKWIKFWTLFSCSRFFIIFYLSKYNIFRKILKIIPHKIFYKIDQKMNGKIEWNVYRKSIHLKRKKR